jgi:hypothetical protein
MRPMIESHLLIWMEYASVKISAAYSPIKQLLSISSFANKPNPVPDAVISPLIPRNNGGKYKPY